MKLNFNLAESGKSFSIDNTPPIMSRRLPFYVTTAGHFIMSRSYFTEREGMENSCLFFYTLGGRGLLRYRGAEVEMLPGQAAIINCYEYQYYATASNEPWSFKWAHIGGPAAAVYEERINGDSLNVVTLGEACRTAQALDSMLLILRDREDFMSDVKVCGLLSEALTELVLTRQHPVNDAGLPRHRDGLELALSYIRANYNRRIGVDDIVGRTNISKYYFLRLFKAYTGMGLYEYLNNHRVDMAKKLLRTSDQTVGGVAQAVGFTDVNSFIRYFKKVAGVTPDVFRRYYLY